MGTIGNTGLIIKSFASFDINDGHGGCPVIALVDFLFVLYDRCDFLHHFSVLGNMKRFKRRIVEQSRCPLFSHTKKNHRLGICVTALL